MISGRDVPASTGLLPYPVACRAPALTPRLGLGLGDRSAAVMCSSSSATGSSMMSFALCTLMTHEEVKRSLTGMSSAEVLPAWELDCHALLIMPLQVSRPSQLSVGARRVPASTLLSGTDCGASRIPAEGGSLRSWQEVGGKRKDMCMYARLPADRVPPIS